MMVVVMMWITDLMMTEIVTMTMTTMMMMTGWAGLGPQENECQHFECFHQGTAPRSITFDHKDHHNDYYEDKRGVDLTEPLKILALPRLV